MFFFSYIFVMVNQKTFYKFKTITKMKKMIFTAMAVLAFSAVSMANTIEVKEEVVVNNESKVEVLNTEGEATQCQETAINIYEFVMNTYNNGVDNLDLLHNLLAQCK